MKLINSQYDWKNLLIELTKKEISVRYKKTFFGFLWMFLNPIAQMLILGFVFQEFTNINIKTDNYFLFLFVGLVVWNFFSNTINTIVPIYVNERALLQKGKFPREIILLSVLLANLFHFFASLIVLFIYLVFYFFIKNELNMLSSLFTNSPLLIVTTLWLGVFTTGIGLIFSALNVKYRDVNFFVTATLPLIFYATPIIWELHFVPSSFRTIIYLNPLTSIIELNRLALLNQPLTSPFSITLGIITSAITLFIGNYIFKQESPYFDDWL